jgi:hypothetical protein
MLIYLRIYLVSRLLDGRRRSSSEVRPFFTSSSYKHGHSRGGAARALTKDLLLATLHESDTATQTARSWGINLEEQVKNLRVCKI